MIIDMIVIRSDRVLVSLLCIFVVHMCIKIRHSCTIDIPWKLNNRLLYKKRTWRLAINVLLNAASDLLLSSHVYCKLILVLMCDIVILFLEALGAVAWTKYFCSYSKDTKIFTMIPFNQTTSNAGKLVSNITRPIEMKTTGTAIIRIILPYVRTTPAFYNL